MDVLSPKLGWRESNGLLEPCGFLLLRSALVNKPKRRRRKRERGEGGGSYCRGAQT